MPHQILQIPFRKGEKHRTAYRTIKTNIKSATNMQEQP